MSNLIQTQLFNSSSIRIACDVEGSPFFCVVDLCEALGIARSNATRVLGVDNSSASKTSAIMGYQIDNPSTNIEIMEYEVTDSLGRIQRTKFICEQLAYELAMTGRSELAIAFRKWLAQVAVQLRKTGIVDLRPVESDDELFARALVAAQNKILAIEAREAKALAERDEAIRTKNHVLSAHEAMA